MHEVESGEQPLRELRRVGHRWTGVVQDGSEGLNGSGDLLYVTLDAIRVLRAVSQ